MKKTHLTLSALAMALSASAYAQGVPVQAMTTEQGEYQPSIVLTGKLEAQEHANLTPRVTGYLQRQTVADGAFVKKGDVLFEIDPTPYQLILDSAQANKHQAQAALQQAELTFERIRNLQGTGGATQANLDDATAAVDMAKASLAAAIAGVNKAQDDLFHTRIRAPYDGQIGKSRFSTGDMVSPATGALIDIAQLTPLNASFSVSYDQFNDFAIAEPDRVRISLKALQQAGELTFIDNKINPNTGTVELSATFDNQDNRLKPNQIARIKVTSTQSQDGVWIPQKALMQDLLMQFVYVVNGDGLAERREVSVESRDGQQAFISQGLTSGEQVITEGLVRVRPNVPVSIQQ